MTGAQAAEREIIEGWKQWHREIVAALGLDVIERGCTLTAVKDLVKQAALAPPATKTEEGVVEGVVVAPLGDEPDDYVAVDTPSGYTFSTTLTSPVGQALLRYKGQRVRVLVVPIADSAALLGSGGEKL